MKHKYLKNVVSLSYADEKCVGCSRCVEVCPHGVFEMNEEKVQIVDRDFCMECGACALNCLVRALSVNQGVGCAAAFIFGWITGTEPSCDSNASNTKCC